MGTTPIERDSEHTADTDVSGRTRGIRARVRVAVSRLLDGVRAVVTSDGGGTEPGSSESSETVGEIVVGDQRKNLPATDSRPRAPEDSPDGPPTPAEQPTVSTRREGDRFRIYDQDDPEAYVSSDEWVPIER